MDAGSVPVVLYADQGGPVHLALDQDFVYWSSYASGLIQRMPKDGGDVQVLAQVPRLGNPEILLDDTTVYFMTADTTGNRYIGSVAKTGGGGTMLYQSPQTDHGGALRMYGGYFYWLIGGPTGPLVRMPKSVGPTETLTPDYNGMATMAIGQQYIYWSIAGDNTPGQGAVYRLPTGGTGQIETLLSGIDSPRNLALDANRLYVGIGANPSTTGRIVALDQLAATPSNPVTVIDNQSGVEAMAVDDTDIYWITDVPFEGIFKAPKAGGGPATALATGQPLPSDIAVDDRYIFWVNSSVPNGALVRLKK